MTLDLVSQFAYTILTTVIGNLVLVHYVAEDRIRQRTKILEFDRSQLKWVTIFRVKLLQVVQDRDFTQLLTNSLDLVFRRIKAEQFSF